MIARMIGPTTPAMSVPAITPTTSFNSVRRTSAVVGFGFTTATTDKIPAGTAAD